MEEIKPNILVIDDAPDMLELACAFLENAGNTVIQKSDGESALAYLDSHYEEIDLVLSDILMPGIDGYQLCSTIKEDSRFAYLPVIFMSSLTDLEEKIKGYSHGADDYVVKPVAFEELNEKIRRILEIREKNKQLTKQIGVSNSAALEAMTYSSDLGQVLNFYKTSLNSDNYEQLAANVFELTGFLSLKASILFSSDDGIQCFGDRDTLSPLESNILEMARGKSRFYDFNSRTIVNYPHFSLLIKNMPLDRPERYGTLKDTLGSLGDAIEARTKALISNSLEGKRTDLIKTVQGAMEKTGKTMQEVQQRSESAIDVMMEDIEDAFISLGLTEQQEQKIRDIVGQCLVRTKSAFEQGAGLNLYFENIKSQLNESLKIKPNI